MITAESSYIGNDRKRGPIEAQHRVRKGFTRRHLAQLFAERGYTSGVEVGVADGRNSLTLCQHIPGLQLLCVDPWRPYDGNQRGGPQAQHSRNLELAQQRLAPYDVHLFRHASPEAAGFFWHRSFDFAYIDGNHAYRYVRDDLEAWYPLVRSGGIMAGHDYYEFNGAGVIEAVNEFTARHGIANWSICDEREPSFWWVKP